MGLHRRYFNGSIRKSGYCALSIAKHGMPYGNIVQIGFPCIGQLSFSLEIKSFYVMQRISIHQVMYILYNSIGSNY
jgi:hypothetical protein